MKENPENQTGTQEPPHPLDVMREVYRSMEFHTEENDDRITVKIALENMEVVVTSWGNPNDVATVIVHLPVRATGEFRAKTGEFLHRLNYDSKRKFWEIDYKDGEIRMGAYTDTLIGPLTEEHFRGILHCMVVTSDIVFPYLTSVLSGRMAPDFAADQADAAIYAHWTKGNNPEDEGEKAEGGE